VVLGVVADALFGQPVDDLSDPIGDVSLGLPTEVLIYVIEIHPIGPIVLFVLDESDLRTWDLLLHQQTYLLDLII